MTTAQEYLEKRWTARILLCVAQFIVVLDASIVNVALPSIRKALNFSTGVVATLVLIRTRDSKAHVEMSKAEASRAEPAPVEA